MRRVVEAYRNPVQKVHCYIPLALAKLIRDKAPPGNSCDDVVEEALLDWLDKIGSSYVPWSER